MKRSKKPRANAFVKLKVIVSFKILKKENGMIYDTIV